MVLQSMNWSWIAAHRLDRRRLDVVGGIHFRLTASEAIDLIALCPQGLGLIGDCQSEGGSDPLNA